MKPSRTYHGYTAYHREPGGLRRLDYFVDRLEAWRGSRMPSDIRILDIGCGNGNIALPIASLGYRVLGVDGDAISIAQARNSAKDLGVATAEFRQGWTEMLYDERFDVVIASEVLEHQKEPDQFLSFLRSTLKQDGIMLLSVPNGTSLEENVRWFTTHTFVGRFAKRLIKRVVTHETVQSQAAHPHQQFFSWPALRRVLVRNGLGIEHVSQAAAMFKESFYLGGRSFINRGSEAFQHLDAADAWLAARLPIPMADGWLLELRPYDATKPLVMHILPALAGGGAERVVLDLCARLPAEGFRVQAVSLLRGGPLEAAFRQAGIPLIILNKRGFLGLDAVRDLTSLLQRRAPAIVHTHLFGADVWGRAAAVLAGIRVRISTEHNVNLSHGMFRRMVKRVFAPLTTRFVAVSDEVRRYMVAKEGIPRSRISVIRNGIDLSRVILRSSVFHAQAGVHQFASPVRLLVAGRLTEQKGVDVLLRALALVGTPWFLQIAGTGEKEIEWKTLAERLGLAPRIRWLGHVDNVPALLAESDILCFPSRWEGLGLSLLEAAAAGVPIVASDLPVFHEVLDYEDAEFAPVGDAKALALALNRVLSDQGRALFRAETLQPQILKNFSAEAMTKSYAALYRKLL